MIKTTTELNAEALSAVRAIHLASPGNVKKRHLVRNVAVIVAVVMVLFAAVYVPQQNYATAAIILAFGAICLWMGFKGGYLYQDHVMRKRQAASDPRVVSGIRENTFDESGVTVFSDMGGGKNVWESFNLWGICQGYFYLQRIDNQYVLVKLGNLTAEEQRELCTLATAHLGQPMSFEK